jgi:hypothetical protein
LTLLRRAFTITHLFPNDVVNCGAEIGKTIRGLFFEEGLKERTGKGKGYAFVPQMCGKRLFHIVKAVQRSEGVCETGESGKIRAGKRKHMKIPWFFLDGC